MAAGELGRYTRTLNGKTMKIGIAWYTEEQWRLLKSVASDAESLDDTYESWRKNAESLVKEIERTGNDPVKVSIDVRKLVEWCREHNKPIDSESRSEYVAVLLRQKYG